MADLCCALRFASVYTAIRTGSGAGAGALGAALAYENEFAFW